MKRPLATIATALLVLSSAACGLRGGNDHDFGGTDDRPVVGFVQVGSESAWRKANSDSIQVAAVDDDRIAYLQFANAEQDQQRQIEAIRELIEDEVDVIVLAPVVESGWTEVLTEADRAGIPVILADRAIDEADEHLYETRLGSDFVEEGRKAARWTVETFAGENAGLVEIGGTPGSAAAEGRNVGYFEVLEDEDLDYELVDSEFSDFTVEGGKEVMEGFIDEHGLDRIDLLFAHNDEMGIGAADAIEAAGYDPGDDVQIIIVDGSRAGFEAGVAGRLNYIVECNPSFGPQLMDLVVDVLDGKDVDKFTPVEEGAFGPEDFEDEVNHRDF